MIERNQRETDEEVKAEQALSPRTSLDLGKGEPLEREADWQRA